MEEKKKKKKEKRYVFGPLPCQPGCRGLCSLDTSIDKTYEDPGETRVDTLHLKYGNVLFLINTGQGLSSDSDL